MENEREKKKNRKVKEHKNLALILYVNMSPEKKTLIKSFQGNTDR